LAGSLVGALLGTGLSGLAARYVEKSLAGLYGVVGQPARGVEPLILAGAIAAGVVWSVLAAVFPATAAARADPVRALQKGRYEIVELEERRTRRLLACAAISMAALLLAGRLESWFVVSYVLAAFALILLTPELCSAIVHMLRPLLQRIRPVEGALAADSLLQAPRRTASVAAALMLSVAMVIGLGGIAEASYQSILDWVTGTLDADFLVAPSENLKDLTLRFPSAMERDLAAIEGLAVVQPVRAAPAGHPRQHRADSPTGRPGPRCDCLRQLCGARAGARGRFSRSARARWRAASSRARNLQRLHRSAGHDRDRPLPVPKPLAR
jgi:putative ABC transport system permease protein